MEIVRLSIISIITRALYNNIHNIGVQYSITLSCISHTYDIHDRNAKLKYPRWKTFSIRDIGLQFVLV